MGLTRKGYAIGNYCISFFFIIVILLLSGPSRSAEEDNKSYINDLIEQANRKKLHTKRYWKVLVHYKKTLWGYKSIIDDPDFFLSKNGRTNPKSELEETIKAFFSSSENEYKHPVCRFIARYTWISEQLNIDKTRLPVSRCSKYNRIIEEIKPQSVTLIFPTSHINNPASMFGHTLLIIQPESENKLLAHAINYSAITPETVGVIFAFKGLFGFYEGYFSVLPYYMKVKEYVDFDYRDIWEYSLNLNKQEVLRMLMHIMELDNIYSDYYFIDENCSYNLLFLLEAARPSLRISGNLKPWVVPMDTIRAIKNNNLINDIHYRPSRTTKIRYIASQLSEKKQRMAIAVAYNYEGPEAINALDDSLNEKIKIFDLAIEYLKFLYSDGKITKNEYRKNFVNLLGLRSKLGNPEEAAYSIPVPVEPMRGHKSSRVSILGGAIDDHIFQEIGFRPAYHDLLDFNKGYVGNGQINFLKGAARYYPSEKKIQLEFLDLLDIISISPVNKFFKPFSWKSRTGLRRKFFSPDESHIIYHLNVGGGVAYKTGYFGPFYFFLESDLNAGNSLDNNYAAGAGGSLGLLQEITSFLKMHAYIKDIYYRFGERHNLFQYGLEMNIKVTTNNNITAAYNRKKTLDFFQRELYIGWNIFF